MRMMLGIQALAVLPEQIVIALLACFLKQDDRFRIIQMILLVLAASQFVETDRIERRIRTKT